MMEENSSANKFISSLVKSLQILCNGHIDFNECIELVGHLNVKIDHKYKFHYIVDEQVSKLSNNSSTFVSNSYHSSPPSRLQLSQTFTDDKFQTAERTYNESVKKSGIHFQQGTSGPDVLESFDKTEDEGIIFEDSPVKQNLGNKKPIKMEGDISNDVVVLPGPPENCGQIIGSLQNEPNRFPMIGDCFEGSQEILQPGSIQKQRQTGQGCAEETEQMTLPLETRTMLPVESCENEVAEVKKTEFKFDNDDPIESVRQLVSRLASLCSLSVVQEKLCLESDFSMLKPSSDDMRATRKKLLEYFTRDKIRKMKEVLRTRKGKRRKQELKALIAETGLTNEQLLLLAHNITPYQRKINWKSVPDGSDKKDMLRDHKKALRLRTQERQERLLEMAEMLKRNQLNEQGLSIISRNGSKKCTLNKSSVSVISHNTQQLTIENIDEAIDALTGKMKKSVLLFKRTDKQKEDPKLDLHKKNVVKRKVKQIVGKILSDVCEAGYRTVFTNTMGSDAGSHSAELAIVPVKIDEILPENKDADVKGEMSEEEYAKLLEREHFIEKQKANEEKMKELEDKLIRILTGTEEIYISTRKRYNPGDVHPTDAERMKDFRKKLKEDPEKYQVFKQKRAITKKRRRLSVLAAKMKDASANPQVLTPNQVTDDTHVTQPMGSLVTITQPSVGNVNLHCPQVYGHPSEHEPPASVVNVHHSNQFVGQVSGMHASHHQQQPMSYGNEMDIVELIAATHSVQNQHFA